MDVRFIELLFLALSVSPFSFLLPPAPSDDLSAVLESWLDYTGELEPPDPLTRLPQLKHRIRQMLTDLGTVQQISLCSSKT